MNIIINSLNYYPELTGIGKYTAEMAEWLASKGHRVTVVTAPPYYPTWRVQEGYSPWRFQRESISGVDVWRSPLWVPKTPSGFKRLLHLASFTLSCFPNMFCQFFRNPDLVIVIEPPLFCAPLAYFLAQFTGAKSVLHIQDFEVDAAFDLGLIPLSWLKSLTLRAEKWLMHRFSRVSTISCAMCERLRSKGIQNEQVMFFPNWVDTDIIFPNIEAGQRMRQYLSIPQEKIVVLYSGNIGKKQGLETLLAVAQTLHRDESIQFVICGAGACKEDLVRDARELKNISFLPLQPLDKLNDLLNMADIHVLPQRADAADLVMPSKLLGILACGGAVVATANPGTELAGVIEAAGGVVCQPENAGLLSRAIAMLANRPQERSDMAKNARRYAIAHLEKEHILKQFLSDLEVLAGKAMERTIPLSDEVPLPQKVDAPLVKP